MNNIIEINLRSGEKKELNTKETLEEIIESEFEDIFSQVGFTVEEIGIKDREKFARKQYENENYSVARVTPNTMIGSIADNDRESSLLVKYIENNFDVNNVSDILVKGVPDFIVYKPKYEDGFLQRIEEMFFLEVKSNDGGLTKSQTRWIFSENHDMPVKVCFL